MEKVKITVFTPVYNRDYCVKNVYRSLLLQTFQDFEWLVINDGSTDNTAHVIGECVSEGKLRITYLEKENGGQHRALNDAITYANGQLLMIVDSDDDLTENALEMIDYYEQTICGKPDFAGVGGLRRYRDGTIIGTSWPEPSNEFIDLLNTDRYKKNMLLGDKAEAYYVDVLRKFYPMPEFDGENDVEKGWLWNRISNGGYKIRWFNVPIYNCEYLNDGMSRNIVANYIKNFRGYSIYVKEFIRCDIGMGRKVRLAVVYCEIAREKGCGPQAISNSLCIGRVFSLFAFFISYVTPVRFWIRKCRRHTQAGNGMTLNR